MKRTLYLATLLWCWALLVQAQSQINSTVQVHPGGHMGVYGNLNFNAGYVITPRSAPGNNIYFTTGTTHTGASDASHVNGYAEEAGHAVFTFPIGNGTSYRWAGIASASTAVNYRAAYFSGNPGSATLPTGAPFATTSRGTGVEAVSTVEYWDIDGSAAASITLSWNAASNLATLAGGNPNQLVIVGWNGSQWVNLGQAGGVSGTLGGSGSVTATNVTPDTYAAYTFGSLALPLVAISSPASSGTATTSPTVSGTATPNSTVTLTGPGNTTLCTTTVSASGAYSCAVTLAAGPNSITAVACNSVGCSSPVISSFTVVRPASLTVAPPQPGPTTQPISGTATPNSTVTLTGPGNTTLCMTTASASGTFSCNVTVPTGPSNVTVTACNGGGCATQAVSVTGVGAPTVAITSPATNGTATTSPTVSGTATPGSVVTLTGPNNTILCTTTASASGAYSCAVTVPTGLVSITAVASNAGGVSSPAVGSFTVLNLALFNCASTSLASTSLVAGTAQNSTLTLGLVAQVAQSLVVTVNGTGGFSSVPSPYVALVTAGQASLSIPVSYDGSGSAGVYSLTVSSPLSGNSCVVSATVYAPTPCTSPVPGPILAGTMSPAVNGTNSFTYVSNTSGSAVRWFIAPSSTASPSSGTGTTTGNITFLKAGGYQVIFEETNTYQPAGCSVPATVQSTLDTYIRPQTTPCASPGSSTVVVAPSSAAIAAGGSATFTLNGGQPYQNVEWQVLPSNGASPATGSGATASVTFSQEGLYRVVFTMTNAGNLTCTPVQKVSSALIAVGQNPCASPSDIVAINATSSSGTAATGTTQTFQATGGVPGQMIWKVYPTTGVSSTRGTGNSASITFTQPGNYVVTFIATNGSLPLGCTKPMTIASNVGIVVFDVPTVGITSPANNGTATTSPTVSGTATPNSTVTLTGPGNTTLCTTTASASGAYSCAVTLAAGPNSITAVACNSVGCSSPVISSFTVVRPASLTVAPPQPGPTTQPISGTATPNSTVTLTGPGNTPLCTTTASASGTFSCNVTVPTGPSNVTVTACNGGGCATQVVSVTGVGAPTVAITSPATNGTATTSPTVSGTATPNSTVTLTGPNNTILCSTTATAAGNYNCAVTLSPGPNSITAVACSAGGCSSPAVSSFTVTGSVQLAVRVFLQGALINSTTSGRMRDDLRSKGVIPTIEPYSAMNYTHIGGGGESITSPSVLSVTGANAIVDWVVVELRDANTPSTVIATRSALVQSDGDIVATDGVSPVTFGSAVVSGPSYYVAVRHRNHLGAMTASALPTSATSALVVDFTSASTPVYQYPVGNPLRTSAPMAMQNGVPALWAGNTSGDSRVIMQGPSNDPDPIFFDVISDPNNTSGFNNYVRNNVYSVSDIDLNGRVIFQGPNNEVDLIFFEVMSHPDNQVNQYVNFIIRQQLP